MLLLTGAFIAGILTTLAPCVLPLLPVIVGGSIGQTGRKSFNRALLVSSSLGLSVIVFTLLLKATTYFIAIPNSFWQWISGLILIALGLFAAIPTLYENISMRLSLQSKTTPLLSRAREREGKTGAILTGAALGPVFSSCSPMYAYVIVTVLPASFAEGLALLFAYSLGLCGTLLLVAWAGQRLIKYMGWAVNPEGLLRRSLGWIFIVVGIVIIAGWDKDLQTWILENSPIRPWEIDSNFIP